MKKTWIALLILVIAAILGLGYFAVRSRSDAEVAGRTKLVVQLQWEPGAQFIGFYVARANNYYADEGLAVDFIQGGPNVDPIKNVTNGTAQIGLATADQVLLWTDKNHDESTALAAVGTVFNGSLARFMSRKTAGITTPKDFAGKKIGVFPSYDTDNLLRALLKRNQMDPSQVTIVQFPSLQNFESGQVDVFGAYVINEPIWAADNGIDVNLLDPAAFGIEFYSDTIITTKRYRTEQEETLKKFVRASIRGWSYAQQNTEKALDSMAQEVRGSIGQGRPWEMQRKAAYEAIKHLGDGAHKHLFEMDRSKWTSMATALTDIGRLSGPAVIDRVCDFDFVDKALK